jgi:hypothetical protein
LLTLLAETVKAPGLYPDLGSKLAPNRVALAPKKLS